MNKTLMNLKKCKKIDLTTIANELRIVVKKCKKIQIVNKIWNIIKKKNKNSDQASEIKEKKTFENRRKGSNSSDPDIVLDTKSSGNNECLYNTSHNKDKEDAELFLSCIRMMTNEINQADVLIENEERSTKRTAIECSDESYIKKRKISCMESNDMNREPKIAKNITLKAECLKSSRSDIKNNFTNRMKVKETSFVKKQYTSEANLEEFKQNAHANLYICNQKYEINFENEAEKNFQHIEKQGSKIVVLKVKYEVRLVI